MTYVNPHSVRAVGILFPILGAIAVGLRFWFQRHQHLSLQLDDWLCIPALILLWVEGGLQVAGAKTHSFGWHSPTASYEDAMDFLTDDSPPVAQLGKLQTAFDLIHPIALGMLKLSICFFYRRLFRGSKFNIASWVAIITVILWMVAFVVTIAAACGTHVEANWGSFLMLEQQCVDTFRVLLVYAISDVIVDLAILLIPIPLVFRLQMPVRRKFAVCGVLLIGALAMACGITRMVIFIEVFASPLLANSTIAGLPATDHIGVGSLILFWGMVELGVGMIAICLPTLRALFTGCSLEGVIRSVRSIISLQSLTDSGQRSHSGSGGTGPHSLRSRDAAVRLGSEERLTETKMTIQSFQKQSGMDFGNKSMHFARIESQEEPNREIELHFMSGRYGNRGIKIEREVKVEHGRH